MLLALTRQNLPTLDRNRYASADGVRQGAYVLRDADGGQPDSDPDRQRLGSGSDRRRRGAAAGGAASPCAACRCRAGSCSRRSHANTATASLPPRVGARLAVELGAPQGWERYIGARGDMLGIDHFGASAPADVLLREFGFTVDNVVQRAKALLPGKA